MFGGLAMPGPAKLLTAMGRASRLGKSGLGKERYGSGGRRKKNKTGDENDERVRDAVVEDRRQLEDKICWP